MTSRTVRRATDLSRAVFAAVQPLENRILFTATISPVSTSPTDIEPTIVYSIPATPISSSAVVGHPNALTPQMMRTAYGFNDVFFKDAATGQTISGTGAGQTIAIIDAFGDPTIVTDLEKFDANFGLSNADSAGDFALSVEQPEGGPEGRDQGWSLETALDVEWAHAIAPLAHIDLIITKSNLLVDLFNGVRNALEQPGVNVISMSWGGEDSTFDLQFNGNVMTPPGHSPVMFVASSGDGGAGDLEFPATAPTVLSVGGTTLDIDGLGDYLGETPWVGASGGVSTVEGTTEPLVSYDADPASGVWVYDANVGGWIPHIGGTSIAAPQWAALLAIANQGRAIRGVSSLQLSDVTNVIDNSPGDFRSVSPLFGFFTGETGVGSPLAAPTISSLVGGGITTASPDQLAFVQQPTGVVAGNLIGPDITVALEDSSGNIINNSGTTIDLDVLQGPIGGTEVFGTISAVTVNGIATFTTTSLHAAGSYRLEAVDADDHPAISNAFTVLPGAAAELGFISQPTTSWQYGAVVPGVKVAVEDIFGNPVNARSRVVLTIDTGPAGAQFVAPHTAVSVGGVAYFNNVAVDTPGTYTLLASDGLLAQVVSDSYEVVALPAATQQFLFSGIHLSPFLFQLRERRIALTLTRQGPPPA